MFRSMGLFRAFILKTYSPLNNIGNTSLRKTGVKFSRLYFTFILHFSATSQRLHKLISVRDGACDLIFVHNAD